MSPDEDIEADLLFIKGGLALIIVLAVAALLARLLA